MKNNLVRAFVVVLALAGFGATTVSARTATRHAASTSVIGDGVSPTPMCVPSDPTLCGLH